MGHRRQAISEGQRPTLRGLASKAGALLIGIALVVGVTAGVPIAAHAANPTAGFNPGNIISDAKFYDSDAMTSAQVQSFLNARVPRCTIGDPGREAWSPYGSTFIASVCLRDSRWTTQSRTANAYCKALPGKSNELAASYLVRVGRACGISQRVLLILLEKEQSLVTDTWPTARQYDRAMGHNCPDSGPNNSANCLGDGGFPSQVYRAAWQMKVYRAFPNSYNYQPSRSNTVQWHPNASCGTSPVYIENWATAALYIYTPYRPNRAALNAGWGTGDSCSSYGNRNFYNYYTSWFGSTSGGFTVHSKLKTYYSTHKNIIGTPTGAASSLNGGLRQVFSKGRMYWHPKTGTSFMRNELLAEYIRKGEIGSILGAPVLKQFGSAHTTSQRFQNGQMFWSSSDGYLQLRGTTYRHYIAKGGGPSLGVPLTNQTGTTTSGVMQDFSKKTTLTWAGTETAKRTIGKIRERYLWEGGVAKYGYALAGQRPVDGGLRQRFSKAELYWNEAEGKARAVTGGILTTMQANGGYSKVGLPTSFEFKTNNGLSRQNFSNGYVLWSKSGGGQFVAQNASISAESSQGPSIDPRPSERPEPEDSSSPQPEPIEPESPEPPQPEDPEVLPPEVPEDSQETNPDGEQTAEREVDTGAEAQIGRGRLRGETS